mgnify:CR=1 FL=1
MGATAHDNQMAYAMRERGILPERKREIGERTKRYNSNALGQL